MSNVQIDFCVMMVKNAILPDGTTVYDLMLRPDIGQEEARIAFEAALKGNPQTFDITMHAVRVFAETHGFNSDKAHTAALHRVCDAILADRPKIRH